MLSNSNTCERPRIERQTDKGMLRAQNKSEKHEKRITACITT